ncbi:ABC transporter permease [Priestia flexa]|uniref:ABC transporter permease n=1 Tax=Priestia TaxID=2800373 RepID=UPI0037C7E979
MRQVKIQFNTWSFFSFLFITVVLLPIFIMSVQFFSEPSENWTHIKEFLLANYLITTVTLVSATAIFTAFIGVSTAWLLSAYDFPMRSFFKWGLILPLAIPPYIGAYTYHGILNYTGVIQATLRNSFDITVNQKYFTIMNVPGAIFIFTIFLYPYVYIITKSFLEKQSASLIENARLLGSSPLRLFFRVVLPISRAAVIGGVSLVSLEVLNDFGVVKYFGVQTFSTAIFQAWFGMSDLGSAIKLSGMLMLIVVGLLTIEKVLRGRKRFGYSTTKVRPLTPVRLKGVKAWGVFLYFLLIFMVSFLIPFAQLTQWALMTYEQILNQEFLQLIWNSTSVAFISASIIIVIALVVGNFTRLFQGVLSAVFSKVIILGYSVPGAVISIGVLALFLILDQQLFTLYEQMGKEPTLVLSVSVAMLIFAYVIRFLSIGYNSVEAGFSKVGVTFTEASRTLGMSMTKTFFKVDMKLIKGAIFGGFILVFIDILKELTLTLILQPFNFSTLATKAFEYAGNEMIHEAAVSSMLIILISGVSIFFFHKVLEKE